MENAYITSTGEYQASTSNGLYPYISVEGGKKITFSTAIAVRGLSINEYTSDKTFIKRTQVNTGSNNTTLCSVTLDNNTVYIRIAINYNNSAMTQANVDTIYAQLEYGTPTSYEPYGNNWYIEKNIGMYDSWTSVNRTSTYTNTISYQFVLPMPTDSSKRQYALCNYFQNAINNNDNEHAFVGTSTVGVYAGLNVFINKTRATTSEEAIAWLKNNGVKFYYVLANPTYEVITNTNLIEQLNNIQDIGLIENLCYVDWVGSIAPTMLLQYPTNETLNAYLITEDNKLIRTDWRFIGRRK